MQLILPSFRSSFSYQWEQGQAYIYTTSFAISVGERLSSRWRPCLWQCIMQAGCFSLVCNQRKSRQCRLLEPSDPADHQPKPVSDKQKLSLGSIGYQWGLHGSVRLLNHGHLMPSEMAEDGLALAFSYCFRRVPHVMPLSPQACPGYPRKIIAYLFQTFLL